MQKGAMRYFDVKSLPNGEMVRPLERDFSETDSCEVWKLLDEELDRACSVRKMLPATLSGQDTRDAALALLEQGFNPVLLVSATRLEIIPDVLLSLLVADSRTVEGGVTVVPLARLLETSAGMVPGELSRRVSLFPTPRVWRRSEDGLLIEHEILRVGYQGFTLARIGPVAETGS